MRKERGRAMIKMQRRKERDKKGLAKKTRRKKNHKKVRAAKIIQIMSQEAALKNNMSSK